MTSPNPFLTNWVRNAYSMEMGLVSVLEQQTGDEQTDPQLRKGLDRHLQATRQHAELLRGCLHRMGDNVAQVQPSNPIERLYGAMDSDGVDPTLKTQLLDFVTENFEAASYKAISTLALQFGDIETARVCQQILKDEMAIAHALDDMLPVKDIDGGEAQAIRRENVRTVRAGIEAINTHNLKMFENFEDERIQIEPPGALYPLDKREFGDYLLNFFSAFPDLHFEIGRTLCDGDTVVLHWICTGTHRGRFRLPEGFQLPPTNRKFKLPGSGTLDLQDGLCIHASLFWDNAALMAQLGIIAQP